LIEYLGEEKLHRVSQVRVIEILLWGSNRTLALISRGRTPAKILWRSS